MHDALAPLAAPSGVVQPRASQISCTRGLAEWLSRHDLSLAFTSYQSGRLYLCGNDDGRVHFHERFFIRAMALWADA